MTDEVASPVTPRGAAPFGVEPPTTTLEPLAELVLRCWSEPDPYRRVWRLIDSFEWAIKWSTAVVVGDLLDRMSVPKDLRARLVSDLYRPSLGNWLGFYRDAVEAAPGDRPWSDWDRLLRLEDRHRIVAMRNEYAHGAVERNDQAESRFARAAPALVDLLASPFFQAGHLERQGSDPPTAHAVFREHGFMIDLWPLASFLQPDAPSDAHALYFHNALRRREVEALNYELPDRTRRAFLYPLFLERLPLTRWSAAAQDLLDPHAALAAQLSGGMVGRDAAVEALLGEIAGEPGESVILGPPGQGKSAVMAAVSRRFRIEHDDELVVIDSFLRRGDAASSVRAILRSWLDRLSILVSVGTPTDPNSSLEDLHEALQLTLRQWQHRRDSRELLFLVDGLDENLDLLPYLPSPQPGVRVVWSARPVQAVDRAIRDRVRPHRRHPLEPLDLPAVRAVLYRAIDKLDRRLGDDYLRAVLDRSKGNPLYLDAYTEQLFHDPSLVGRNEAIPTRMADLYQNALDRIEAQEARAYDVLVLLAVAHEPLTDTVVSALLGSSQRSAANAIIAAGELLVEPTPGAIALFHDSLRQWLEESYERDVKDMIRRLARTTVNDSEGSAEPYLLRHGVAHVLESADPDLIAQAAGLLSDPEELLRRLEHQGGFELVSDVADVGNAVPAPCLQSLVDALLTVHRRTWNGERPLSADDLHGALMYRPDMGFTDAFLPHAASAASDDTLERARFQAMLAGQLRRRGTDDDRREARELLRQSEVVLGGSTGELLLRSRILYDLGYLDHLEDDPESAIPQFESSAALAEHAGDLTGHWISTCVGDNIAFFTGGVSASEYEATLRAATAHFTAFQDREAGALRWVMNVLAHRFDLACELGRKEEARGLLQQLEEDPWILRNDRFHILASRRARLAILQGDGATAESILRDRIEAERGPDNAPSTREALARDYLELGKALALRSRSHDAVKVWREGLRCPWGGANGIWQSKIRAELSNRFDRS